MKTTPGSYWLGEFRQRMEDFTAGVETDSIAVSIKLKVEGGCFCKNCNPAGHRLIANHLNKRPELLKEGKIVEHESGPEVLTYLNYAAGVFSFAASIISLIVTIAQARAEGAKRGGKKNPPFKLIVRRIDAKNGYKEELLLEIPTDADVDAEKISKSLLNYAKAIPNSSQPKPRKAKASKTAKKSSGQSIG
jgi:hypothetical protein